MTTVFATFSLAPTISTGPSVLVLGTLAPRLL